MQIQLWPCLAHDQSALWPSYRAAFYPIIQAQFGGWDEAEQIEAFAQRIQRDGFMGIWVDGLLAGAMRIDWQASPVELGDLWLEPAYHHRGIGTHLVRWVCQQAQVKGREVQLAVFFANPAQALYARLGFEIVGKTEFQYVMRTALNRKSPCN